MLTGFTYVRLDGETPVEERQPLIDQYTEDRGIFIFLLSTRAGGLGINLAAAADAVILHDLDFNPTTDRQVCERERERERERAILPWSCLLSVHAPDAAECFPELPVCVLGVLASYRTLYSPSIYPPLTRH